MTEDATRLIAALQAKLQVFDDQVSALRQELAGEFTKFSEELLQDVPQDVSNEVSRALAASVVDYPTLFPKPAESPLRIARHNYDSNLPSLPNGRKSPPPLLHHTSGVARPVVATPERETNFEGVFTPLYLPLLGNDSPQSPPPLSPRPTHPMSQSNMSEGTQTIEIADGSHGPSPPSRRNTESSSLDSREGEARIRSALRRSSSASNRASPRRVRFDVQGEEVLPTSSPQLSSTALPQLGNSDSLSQPSARESAEAASAGGSYDPQPYLPPKKLSSSERLRALSKLPLEDPSNWTPVDPNLQSNSDQTTPTGQEPVSAASGMAFGEVMSETARGKLPETAVSVIIPSSAPISAYPRAVEHVNLDSDDSSDDGLSMRSRKKNVVPLATEPSVPTASNQQQLKATPVTSRTLPPIKEGSESASKGDLNVRGLSPKVNGHEVQDVAHLAGKAGRGKASGDDGAEVEDEDEETDDEETDEEDTDDAGLDGGDELFEFEDENQRVPKPRLSKPISKPKSQAYQRRQAAGSDAAGTPSALQLGSLPITSKSSPPISPSVGSYRGRPILFDVVKDPSLHDRARTMGDVSSFVGSVDGRNALDGTDLQSYRASIGQIELFSGTPKSLTERMMMEEVNKDRR